MDLWQCASDRIFNSHRNSVSCDVDVKRMGDAVYLSGGGYINGNLSSSHYAVDSAMSKLLRNYWLSAPSHCSKSMPCLIYASRHMSEVGDMTKTSSIREIDFAFVDTSVDERVSVLNSTSSGENDFGWEMTEFPIGGDEPIFSADASSVNLDGYNDIYLRFKR